LNGFDHHGDKRAKTYPEEFSAGQFVFCIQKNGAFVKGVPFALNAKERENKEQVLSLNSPTRCDKLFLSRGAKGQMTKLVASQQSFFSMNGRSITEAFQA